MNTEFDAFSKQAEEADFRLTWFSDIDPETPKWLWEKRIPLGKLCLLQGDPGGGKSLLSVALAAHVSRGTPWPVDRAPCPSGSALILSFEDGPADCMRPRLDAVEANVRKVACIQFRKLLSLGRDIALIKRWVLGIDDLKLVCVDPIAAFLGDANPNKSGDVYAACLPLVELAHEREFALVAINHLNKNDTMSKALYRGAGSIALNGLARSVFTLVRDKEIKGRICVIPTKNNLASMEGLGLAYRIANGPNGVGILVWEDGPLANEDSDPDEMLSPCNGRDSDAKEWLLGELDSGPVHVEQIRKHAAKEGFTWAAIEKAKTRLTQAGKIYSIHPIKQGPGGKWMWALSHHTDNVRVPPNNEGEASEYKASSGWTGSQTSSGTSRTLSEYPCPTTTNNNINKLVVGGQERSTFYRGNGKITERK